MSFIKNDGIKSTFHPIAPERVEMKPEKMIRVENLHYKYQAKKRDRSVEALSGLSFFVAPKTITGILGPNGSGKSTTFKILSTQLALQEGDAWVNNISLRHQAPLIRKQLGVTFQSPSLDPILTVHENLLIFSEILGIARPRAQERIAELLALFRLSDRRNTRIKELSGGLARRAELAKTLIAEPRVLLLDEPTTGLDPAARIEFWDELRSLRDDRGVTIVVTTHLMDEADLCDELIILNEGKCAAQGTPSQLKAEIQNDCLLLELEDPTAFDGDLMGQIQENMREGDHVDPEPPVIRIATKHSVHWMQALAPLLGKGLRSLNWAKPNLSDVYLKKTGRHL